MTDPATPEELFAGAYAEARHMAAGIVARWRLGATRWSGDLHSAAMEALWRCAVRYDPSRGVPFSYYWHGRLRDAMVDELRRLSPGSRSAHAPTYCALDDVDDPDDAFGLVDQDPTPEGVFVANLVVGELEAAVAALPLPMREALCLEGLTGRAIAAAEGVDETTIYHRKRRARRRVLKHLGPDLVDLVVP